MGGRIFDATRKSEKSKMLEQLINVQLPSYISDMWKELARSWCVYSFEFNLIKLDVETRQDDHG